MAREDHYLSEGQWHVQRRNEALGDGDSSAAWNENLILEEFYAPVLGLGSRWMPEQREQVAATVPVDPSAYVSDAEPYPIFTVSRWQWWAGAALALAIVWGVAAMSTAANERDLRV